jgi:hypothetical protein
MSCSTYFDKIFLIDCIPLMKREAKSSVIRLRSILLNKIDKTRDMWEVILVTLLNFYIGTDILLNSIFSITLSIPIVIVDKMRILHHIFQKMWSINSSTNKNWIAFDYFIWRGCENMFLTFARALVLYYHCLVVYFYFFRATFYIIIECVIGSFHVNRTSFWLIQWRPGVPLKLILWFESPHIFRRFINNLINVQRLNLSLRFFKSGIDLHYSLASCFDITFSCIYISVAKPKCSLFVNKGFIFSYLLLDFLQFLIWSSYKSC